MWPAGSAEREAPVENTLIKAAMFPSDEA